MTNHPCKGMTAAQRAVFEQIAIGNALPPCPKGIIAKLLAKQVIDVGAPKVFRDRLGEYSIPQYFVPRPVHWQWCEWCSEQPENQEIA